MTDAIPTQGTVVCQHNIKQGRLGLTFALGTDDGWTKTTSRPGSKEQKEVKLKRAKHFARAARPTDGENGRRQTKKKAPSP